LECNIATSAGGSFRVGILNAAGEPIPGFSLNDCKQFYGDNTAMTPLWRGGECPPLQAGDTFRLQFEMIECDLFSFCFVPPQQ
jgi:hypothetical protein